jgi:hypothetical protein
VDQPPRTLTGETASRVVVAAALAGWLVARLGLLGVLLALPLVVGASRLAGTTRGTLCFLWLSTAVWCLIVGRPAELALLFSALAVCYWLFAPDEVDGLWRALWRPGPADGRASRAAGRSAAFGWRYALPIALGATAAAGVARLLQRVLDGG